MPPGPIPADDETRSSCSRRSRSSSADGLRSVWVNANGKLTFDPPGGDLAETPAEMLSGPPHIAALWDDLNAAAAPGSVTYAESLTP